MPCTTLLVGKKASYDGSTIMARNDDSSNGNFTPKRVDVVHPQDQPKIYRSVTSHVEVDLSDETPVRYTYVPDAVLERKGIWGAAGMKCCTAPIPQQTMLLTCRLFWRKQTTAWRQRYARKPMSCSETRSTSLAWKCVTHLRAPTGR